MPTWWGSVIHGLASFIGLAGVVYGVVRAAIIATGPMAISITSSSNGTTETTEWFLFGSPLVQAITVPAAVLLLTAPPLVLLFRRQRHVFALYVIVFSLLSFVTGLSVGYFFYPTASLLFLSLILIWLTPSRRSGNGPEVSHAA